MTKNRIFALITTTSCLLFNFQPDATADVPIGLATEPIASPTENTSASPGKVGKSIASSKHLSLAKKFFGVAAGVVVGTPVCAVRKPLDEDKYAIADLAGNSKKARAVVPTAVLWAPFACVQGILEAPFFAINNSLVNYDKPFSKEQFSLVNPGAIIKEEEKLPIPHAGDVR